MVMKEKSLVVSVLEFRRLATEIKEHSPNICIRYRLMGNMWKNHFVRIVNVTENRMMVNDETDNKLISINLGDIMQFELDSKYQNFEPNYHYEVSPFSFSTK
jgi:arginyl-tRNA--protein-N-Asp/Glu arginylyltransferase